MKEIDVDELKTIQIDILDCFDKFCKEKGIHYWLDYGTLLGAIRHKGYIPWDDDVDIGMLRSDYQKAERIFNDSVDGPFKFETLQTDKSYRYPFGKIIQTNTALYEYGEGGIKTGVYIDVFPYDNSPTDSKIRQKMFRKRDNLGRLRRLKLPMREDLPFHKVMLYNLGSTLLRLFPDNYIDILIDRNAQKYSATETGKVSSFTDTYETKHLCVNKSIFNHFIDVEFEGKKYYAPKEYDLWLSLNYDDYMKLPPLEEQVPHHVFTAYYTD